MPCGPMSKRKRLHVVLSRGFLADINEHTQIIHIFTYIYNKLHDQDKILCLSQYFFCGQKAFLTKNFV